jgi:hypothetical protein
MRKTKAKPGIKTTEFWATLLGSIIVAGGAELGIELNDVSVGSIAAMVVMYIVSRICHKNVYVNNGQLQIRKSSKKEIKK